MSKMTLREINAEIERVLIDTPYDDENEDAVQAELTALNLQFDEKIENIAYVRLEQKAYMKRLREEKARLDQEIKNIEARGKWLDFYVMAEMVKLGIKSWKGKLLSLSIRKSPVSAEVPINPDDNQPVIESIDPRFLEVEVKHKVKKADAIAHYKQTSEVPEGFTIITDREHLRIG